MPYVIPEVEPVWHIFAIRCKHRDDLEKYLNEKSVGTNKHYPIPMHMQNCYTNLGIHQGELPIAEEISATELSLPMFFGMTDEQVHYVINTVNSFED